MRRVSLTLTLAFVACGGPAPKTVVPVIVAQLDPSLATPLLPLPNELAMNPDTGLIDAPDPADANDAERAFGTWLRTLDGFPVTGHATATFSGDVDPATVSATTVLLFDLTSAPVAMAARSITYDARTLTVDAVWAAGHTYGIALMGAAQGLKGAKGEAVVGSAAFDLLRAKYPLVTCSDLTDPTCRSANPGITGTSLSDERLKALKMEKARLAAKPVIDTLEAQDTPRENLALVWTFRTATETVAAPLVTFKPEVRAIPFPCDALLVNGLVSLPAEPSDDALVTSTKADLGKLDGFSTTAAIVTEHSIPLGAVGGTLDAAALGQFHVIDLDRSNEDVAYRLSTNTSPDQVLLTPAEPLRSHHRYAVLWMKGTQALATGAAWALMTAGAPLTDATGLSRIRTLDNGDAQGLERLRQSVNDALAAADALGLARADVLLGWTFTTQTTAPTLAELRNKPAQWSLPTTVTGGPGAVTALTQLSLLAQVSALYGKDFNSQLRAALEGRFTTGNALDVNATELDLSDPANPKPTGTEGAFTPATLATPRQEQLYFILFLPVTPKYADGRIPLIVFQHGITRFRRDAAIIANTIATFGFATLAIDEPLHGDRSYCTVAADCADGNCTGNRCPGGYTVSNDLIDQDLGTPAISGLKFGSTTNLAATRDQLRQLIIDTAQLIRVVQDTTNGIGAIDVDDPATTTVTEKLETVQLGYIGMSLGGILGTLVVAANPEFVAATLNVTGASPADILTQAQVPFLADRKKALDAFLLASRGLSPGTQGYDDFFVTARWMLDPADGQNAGRLYIDEPLPTYPKKRIFISWLKNDPWVPNPTTELLINSIDHVTAPADFQQQQYMDNGNHSFMLDPSSPIVLQAQTDAVTWVNASF